MMDKVEEKTHIPDTEETKEDARILEMEGKMRILEMDMDRLERRTKGDSRYLRIMTVLWIAMTITCSYAFSRTQENNRTLIKMEQEYTAIHKEHDALIEEIISTHKKMDQQLEETIQSLGKMFGLQDKKSPNK